MGIVIKVAARAEFKTNKMKYLDFELNAEDVIHLQNDILRLEFDPPEFYQFASAVIESANKLIETKNL